MKRNKKPLLIGALAVLLVALVVGGTIAWMTAEDSKVNAFTVGTFNEPGKDPKPDDGKDEDEEEACEHEHEEGCQCDCEACGEQELYIMKVVQIDDDMEEFIPVEDEKVMDQLIEIVQQRFEEDEDDVDEDQDDE